MQPIRSFIASAFLFLAGASALAAQGRIIDEGTFIITRRGAPAQTESFRIRSDNGQLLATGQLNAGTHRISSALTTDSIGTPIDYKLTVRDNGAETVNISAMNRAGRLTARSQVPRGDESTREYPIVAGNSLILDDDLLHQLYFLPLAKRVGMQIIRPRSSRGGMALLTPHGLEPLTIGGRGVTATHYTLTSGSMVRDFWVDSAGRLLQVEAAAEGLKAVREELPR